VSKSKGVKVDEPFCVSRLRFQARGAPAFYLREDVSTLTSGSPLLNTKALSMGPPFRSKATRRRKSRLQSVLCHVTKLTEELF
jgi:hypothetical protein